MKQVFVSDIKSGGNLTRVALGLSEIKKAADKNGNPYWDLGFVDKSGEIKGKVWSENVIRFNHLDPTPGKVYLISGSISEFRGVPQITVTDMDVMSANEYDVADFLAASDVTEQELKKTIAKYTSKITDKDLNNIVVDMLKTYPEYFEWPAATRNHHHFIKGLAVHVIEMLDIAEVVLKHYPEANKSLVYAGIILHDIGKTQELERNGFVMSYGLAGNLMGHITLGVGMIDRVLYENVKKYAKFLKSKKLLLLKHIILSHHSKLEYGSPILPKTIEAGIVARIDVLSNDARIFQRLIENNIESGAEYSPSEFTLDNIKVYLQSDKAFEDGEITDTALDGNSLSPVDEPEQLQQTLV